MLEVIYSPNSSTTNWGLKNSTGASSTPATITQIAFHTLALIKMLFFTSLAAISAPLYFILPNHYAVITTQVKGALRELFPTQNEKPAPSPTTASARLSRIISVVKTHQKKVLILTAVGVAIICWLYFRPQFTSSISQNNAPPPDGLPRLGGESGSSFFPEFSLPDSQSPTPSSEEPSPQFPWAFVGITGIALCALIKFCKPNPTITPPSSEKPSTPPLKKTGPNTNPFLSSDEEESDEGEPVAFPFKSSASAPAPPLPPRDSAEVPNPLSSDEDDPAQAPPARPPKSPYEKSRTLPRRRLENRLAQLNALHEPEMNLRKFLIAQLMQIPPFNEYLDELRKLIQENKELPKLKNLEREQARLEELIQSQESVEENQVLLTEINALIKICTIMDDKKQNLEKLLESKIESVILLFKSSSKAEILEQIKNSEPALYAVITSKEFQDLFNTYNTQEPLIKIKLAKISAAMGVEDQYIANNKSYDQRKVHFAPEAVEKDRSDFRYLTLAEIEKRL